MFSGERRNDPFQAFVEIPAYAIKFRRGLFSFPANPDQGQVEFDPCRNSFKKFRSCKPPGFTQQSSRSIAPDRVPMSFGDHKGCQSICRAGPFNHPVFKKNIAGTEASAFFKEGAEGVPTTQYSLSWQPVVLYGAHSGVPAL